MEAMAQTAHECPNADVQQAFRGVVARAGRYAAGGGPYRGEEPTAEPELPPFGDANEQQVQLAPEALAPLCMIADCCKPRAWKGLCRSCYGQALRLIDQKKTTWEDLVIAGLAEVDYKPFMNAFLKSKQIT